jgi:hypothetical protein
MIRPRKLPADANQRAHQIAKLLTGEVQPEPPEPEKSEVSKYLSEIGRKGGIAGGTARAQALSPRKRSAIAKKAATARWVKPR